jgi:hypothetical protein
MPLSDQRPPGERDGGYDDGDDDYQLDRHKFS